MRLCWNAIVRDESARIERCVNSLLPHITCAVVVDTGSTDDTVALLLELFTAADKPLELRYAPFTNFAQARNEALRRARLSPLDFDYLLLADADMELKVERPDWCNGHSGLAYDMRQVGGALSYYNRRLLSRQATGGYVGVTHEYLDVPSAGTITGAWFLDHADGANRADKFQRDIMLLEQALATETNPGLIERYHFYLAQSYFDAALFEQAAVTYAKRVTLGGYPEEQWYAQRQLARCCERLGQLDRFVCELLRAYSLQPQRAEVLYDLARHFRERGDNHVSLLFSEAGMLLPYPQHDQLFVNDFVYQQGMREEFSICAYYDDRRRSRGASVTNKLALAGNEQAKFNLFWYLRPLSEHISSCKNFKIDFTPPPGYAAMNPSVINHAGTPALLVRTVNYTITPEGQYRILAGDGSRGVDHPIHTRNFIGLAADSWREIVLPANWPPPQFTLVRGFEDSRLIQWQGGFYTLSTVRELTPEGWCEQVLAPIARDGEVWRTQDNWRRILPEARRHEKNWMPWVKDGELRFVYRLGTLLDLDGNVIVQHEPKWKVDHISGGSQVIALDNNMYLALVHEAKLIPGRPNRHYQHRFVVFNNHGHLDGISAPFFFQAREQIEFVAGLAYFPDKRQLVASYGVRDCEAWLATFDPDEVVRFVYREAL
jgi:glycosyltransferase involved in cell wall biosynthesis